MSERPSIVWFRRDLRLSDHAALVAAVRRGAPVICVYVHDPEGEGEWAAGAASLWWLHHSLAALDRDLGRVGSTLILRSGRSLAALRHLVRESGAAAVFWNRRYEPAAIERDTEIKAALREEGLQVESFGGSLLFEPWEHKTGAGEPYRVYTPFWNQVIRRDDPPPPLEKPKRIPRPGRLPRSLALEELELLPRIDWAAGLREAWEPGRSGAEHHLATFGEDGVQAYDARRNLMAEEGTSRLSPHLHFGELSAREVWHAVREKQRKTRGKARDSVTGYLRQIVWREFSYHLLFHYPRTTNEPLRPAFSKFPWRVRGAERDAQLEAWRRGRTGYPVVDAGLRQLWHTGWMHNRARMIVGSFLVKHLLIHWIEGARWFWDTLVDADLANNTMGWQWVAGSGADASPYFRIFNPMTQGQKFDPEGEYVRAWVPELAELPSSHIHQPWKASGTVLAAAGVELGKTYPRPIVDHGKGRERALGAYESTKTRA